MKAADRCAPLGPHQPVEAVARADVRAGALPVLDDPREAGLRERRPDRSCRDLVGHDGHSGAFPIGAFLASAAPKESQAPHRVRGDEDDGTAISIDQCGVVRSSSPRRPVLDTGLGRPPGSAPENQSSRK